MFCAAMPTFRPARPNPLVATFSSTSSMGREYLPEVPRSGGIRALNRVHWAQAGVSVDNWVKKGEPR